MKGLSHLADKWKERR